MTTKTFNIISEVSASLLILLFVYASASKLVEFKYYYGEINNQPFPNQLTPFLVAAIPLSELIAAGLLFYKKTRKCGFYLSVFLMIVFTIYIVLVLLNVFGRTPCTCGGVISKLSWTQHLFFNIFFLLVALLGSILSRNQRLVFHSIYIPG